MSLIMALALDVTVVSGGGAALFLDLPPSLSPFPGHADSRPLSVSAQRRGNPGKLRRMLDKAHRMPKHTKLIIGLCVGGALVFLIGIYAKSKL